MSVAGQTRNAGSLLLWLQGAGAGVVVLLASFAHFLSSNHYPLIRPEAGLIAALLLTGALAMAAVYGRTGHYTRAALDGALVFLAVDINADNLLVAGGLAGLAMISALALRRSVLPVAAVIFGVVLIGALIPRAGATTTQGARPSAQGGGNPTVVHLLLDEHVGVEGIRTDVEGGTALRRDLRAFYERHGFKLFGGAYSRHFRTANAVPEILNLGHPQPAGPIGKASHAVIAENRWFDALARRGLRIHVLQSDYLNHCEHRAVVTCERYAMAELAPIDGAPLAVIDKAELIGTAFGSLSSAVRLASREYGRAVKDIADLGLPAPPQALLVVRSKNSTIAAMTAFDELIGELRQARRGEAYYAHLLAPHHPYAVDERCRFRAKRDWQSRKETGSESERNVAYFAQVRCVMSRLDRAIAAIEASPAGRDAIILIHGDHGSRITDRDPATRFVRPMTEIDLTASYSTLFAVRAPGLAPGYDARRIPAALLLRHFARSNMTDVAPQLDEGFVPTVMIEDDDWRPVRAVAWPERESRPS